MDSETLLCVRMLVIYAVIVIVFYSILTIIHKIREDRRLAQEDAYKRATAKVFVVKAIDVLKEPIFWGNNHDILTKELGWTVYWHACNPYSKVVLDMDGITRIDEYSTSNMFQRMTDLYGPEAVDKISVINIPLGYRTMFNREMREGKRVDDTVFINGKRYHIENGALGKEVINYW